MLKSLNLWVAYFQKIQRNCYKNVHYVHHSKLTAIMLDMLFSMQSFSANTQRINNAAVFTIRIIVFPCAIYDFTSYTILELFWFKMTPYRLVITLYLQMSSLM